MTSDELSEQPREAAAPDAAAVGDRGLRARDVGDRARMESEVRRQRDFYETILTAQSDAGEAFALVEEDGRIVYANEAWERISGYTREELYALPGWIELVPEYDRERIAAEVADRLAGTRTREPFEALMLDRGGRLVWMEGTVAPVEHEGRRRLIAVARDVTDRKLIEDRLRFQHALLEAQTESMLDGLLVVSHDGRVLSHNRRFLELWGLDEDAVASASSEDRLRIGMDRVVDPDAYAERVRQLVADPEAIAREEIPLRDGRTLDRYSAPLRDTDGNRYGRLWVFRDVTAQKRVEERLGFLAGASALLDESLDPRETLDRTTHLFVPYLGDVCSVFLAARNGSTERVALTASDPGGAERIRDLDRRYPIDPTGSHPVAAVIRSGRPALIARVDESVLAAAARDDEHLAALRELSPSSAIVVPLRARGRTFGALVVGSTQAGRGGYGDDDLALVEDVVARAGLAFDNALLYDERSRVASTLQASLLPERLPDLPGLELGSCYRPARTDADIGGDFYDAFATDGGWALVIGDVCGKGAAAAALTGLARHTIRAAALGASGPRRVLGVLNEAIARHGDDHRFCTVALAEVWRAPGGARAIVARAGHPRPLVLRAGGELEVVRCAGIALGFVPDPEVGEVEVELAPGDALLLHTDGLTDARVEGRLLGEEGARELVRGLHGLDAGRMASGVERRLDELGAELRDDLAVLVLRVPG